MKPEKEQWNELLDDAFGSPEDAEKQQENTPAESSAEESLQDMYTEEDAAAPSEEPAPRRKIRLWPIFAAAGLLVVAALCVLFAFKNRPAPEVLRCKEALEEIQSRSYHCISQYSINYEPIKTIVLEGYYVQAGDDKSYSTADYGDWFRHKDTLFKHILFRDGETYTEEHYESEGPASLQQTDGPTPIPMPWPLAFSWDAHNMQLVDQRNPSNYEENFTFFVTTTESGCSCCEMPFFTLQFAFFEGKLSSITQTLINPTGSSLNNYTEHSFSFGNQSEKRCKETIDSIQITP